MDLYQSILPYSVCGGVSHVYFCAGGGFHQWQIFRAHPFSDTLKLFTIYFFDKSLGFALPLSSLYIIKHEKASNSKGLQP